MGRTGWAKDRGAGGSFTAQELLEGDFEALGLEDQPVELARVLHDALRALRPIEARVERAMARGLKRFARGGDCTFAVRGHSRFSDGCEMRLHFSSSHARELMSVDQGLEKLPGLEAAYMAGDLGRGKLRVLLRAATPETEHWWLARSRTRSARALEEDVRDVRAGSLVPLGLGQAECDDVGAGIEVRAPDVADLSGAETDWTRLSLTGTAREQAAWLNHGVEVVRLVTGERLAAWKAAEYAAANALAGSDDVPEAEPGCVHGGPAGTTAGGCIRRDDIDGKCAHERPKRRRAGERHRLRLAEIGRRLRLLACAGSGSGLDAADLDVPDPRRASGSAAVLDVLRLLARWRDRIACERGRLLSWIDGRCLWRRLGASSMAHYAIHAHDVGPQGLRHALNLQIRLSSLPRLDRAWSEGHLSGRNVGLASRVATPRTDFAWSLHAQRCALVRLEIEVQWHEDRLARLRRTEYDRITRGGMPCSDLRLADLRLDSLTALGLREYVQPQRRRGAVADAVDSASAPTGATAGRDRGMGSDAGTGACADEPDPLVVDFVRTWIRPGRFGMRCPAEAAPVVRAGIQAVRHELGPMATDAACLVQAARQLALDNLEPDVRRRVHSDYEVLERDGWRCGNVLCRSRRDLHVHHVRFRSRGGSDDPDNLLTLCCRCHRLLHAGYLAITGTASDGFVQVVLDEAWREGILVEPKAA